jgi:hypothetical protein
VELVDQVAELVDITHLADITTLQDIVLFLENIIFTDVFQAAAALGPEVIVIVYVKHGQQAAVLQVLLKLHTKKDHYDYYT